MRGCMVTENAWLHGDNICVAAVAMDTALPTTSLVHVFPVCVLLPMYMQTLHGQCAACGWLLGEISLSWHGQASSY